MLQWTPSIAVSGIAFYRGDKFPKWKGNLFAAGLAGQQLARLEVAGGKVTHQETLLRGFGRIRHVVNAPDGTLLRRLRHAGHGSSGWCRPPERVTGSVNSRPSPEPGRRMAS